MAVVNAQPGSPLAKAIDPAGAWSQTDYWLASIEYSLRWLVWAKTKDGAKNRHRPKPIKPPAEKEKKTKSPRMSKKALTAFLNAPRIPVAGSKPVVRSLPADEGAPRP